MKATDRQRLEHLCRYVARPPVANGRLRFVDAQTLVFSLKTRWADGTTSLVLSPHELIEKLAALVPPPRLNLIRYHGVLAPAAPDRDQIVPGATAFAPPKEGCRCGEPSQAPCGSRLDWARLLARVFQIDVTQCPSCGGHMKGSSPQANS